MAIEGSYNDHVAGGRQRGSRVHYGVWLSRVYAYISWAVASSSDSAANVGLSPEKSPEAAEVITESRAKEEAGGGGATQDGIASEELLG